MALETLHENTPKKLIDVAERSQRLLEGTQTTTLIHATTSMLESLTLSAPSERISAPTTAGSPRQSSDLRQRRSSDLVWSDLMQKSENTAHVGWLRTSKAAMGILIWIKARLLGNSGFDRCMNTADIITCAKYCLGPDWSDLWVQLFPDFLEDKPECVLITLQECSSLELTPHFGVILGWISLSISS